MRTFSIRKRLGLATAVALVSLGIAGVAYAAVTSGPSRPTFTWANPATYITFNSMTDNPVWGNERQLLKVRDVNAATSAYATEAQVSDNQEIVLAVYFHNNADSSLNLTATNTQVKFELPSNTGTTLSPKAYISADNANPNQVWSTADLTSSQPFSVTYEPGTAKLYTSYVSGAQVSDSVATTGALIGTNGTDGRVQGCAQFSGYVTIRARVHMATPTPTPTPTPPPVPTPVTPTPAVTPAKPVVTVVSSGKSLPNTGPGDIAGLFVGTSALGGVGHYLITRRRH